MSDNIDGQLADLKTCSKCKITKPLSGFTKHNTTTDRLRPSCKTCNNADNRARKAANLERYRALARESTAKWRDANREEINERYREKYWADPEAARERGRVKYNTDVERSRSRQNEWVANNTSTRRGYSLLQKYGMTLQDYAQMEVEQDGLCCVCKKPPRSGKRLCVDHCHTTGMVRRLLCYHCNSALGMLKEESELMAELSDYADEWNPEVRTILAAYYGPDPD